VSDPALEKKFAVLCGIVRGQHFAWREAFVKLAPQVDPQAAVKLMWEITGRDTAAAYLKRIDPAEPLPAQVAELIAASSRAMGEDATAEAADDHAFVVHNACPWFDWHKRLNLVDEDRPGCDAWFQATVEHINRALGTNLIVTTIETLPEGGAGCVRRFSNDAREPGA